MTNFRDTAKVIKLPRLAVLSALLLSLTTFSALAQIVPPASPPPVPAATPCDPQYSQSLSARAWLEAQRELTQNQNLIYKPDSVLEYTCFNRYLNTLAQQANSMFSDNTGRWGGGIGADTLDNALAALVQAAAVEYIGANFENTGGAAGGSYDLLGGRLSDGVTVPSMTGPRDHEFTNIIAPGGYSCQVMNSVWNAAKCVDSIANPAEDGYFTFQQYGASATDKRYLPLRCGSIATRWRDEYNAALVTANTPWTEDAFLTFVGNFQHKETATSTGCAHIDPVPTGLKVLSKEFADYNEKVCFAPGCYYHAGDDECKISE